MDTDEPIHAKSRDQGKADKGIEWAEESVSQMVGDETAEKTDSVQDEDEGD